MQKFSQSTVQFVCTTRKICKTCKCKPEEHDVNKTEEEESLYHVVRTLFSKDSPVGHIRDYFHKLEAANNAPRSEYAKQFALCPLGLEERLVSYFKLCKHRRFKRRRFHLKGTNDREYNWFIQATLCCYLVIRAYACGKYWHLWLKRDNLLSWT